MQMGVSSNQNSNYAVLVLLFRCLQSDYLNSSLRILIGINFKLFGDCTNVYFLEYIPYSIRQVHTYNEGLVNVRLVL